MDEGPSVADLVAAASAGDEAAWNSIVARFSPLLANIISGYRLSNAARQDVAQIVWLRLVENLSRLRSSQALPKWLVTTARHEAIHQLKIQHRTQVSDPLTAHWMERPARALITGEPDEPPEAGVLAQERHQALLAALAELPDRQRELLMLLITEPPLTYAQIADRLGIPIGYIGPTRGRALERLRRTEALQALLDSHADLAEGCGS
jgi:RNA polymerase sigma factor (sigma-70 family)